MELPHVFRKAEFVRPPSLDEGQALSSRHQRSYHATESHTAHSESLVLPLLAQGTQTYAHVVAAHRWLADLRNIHVPRLARSSKLSARHDFAASEMDFSVSRSHLPPLELVTRLAVNEVVDHLDYGFKLAATKVQNYLNDREGLVTCLMDHFGPLELAHRPVRVPEDRMRALSPALGYGIEMELVNLSSAGNVRCIALGQRINSSHVAPLDRPP